LTILSIVVFIFILGIIVLVHEFGHYMWARKFGVHIYEFSIGMGPVVFTHTGKDDIKYRLRLLPIGGFVQMAGEVYEDDNKIPKEKFAVVTTEVDSLPAVIVVNTNLRKFKAKDVFGWSCSLVMKYERLAENGMPTPEESDFVYEYLEELSEQIIGDPSHPNALYLARITWRGTCEVIWQVNNPEPVDKLLRGIIESQSYLREFDYQMEYDATWDNVSVYTQKFK